MFAWLFGSKTTPDAFALTAYEQEQQARGLPYPLWAEPDYLNEYGLRLRDRRARELGIDPASLKQPTPSPLELRVARLESAVFPLD